MPDKNSLFVSLPDAFLVILCFSVFTHLYLKHSKGIISSHYTLETSGWETLVWSIIFVIQIIAANYCQLFSLSSLFQTAVNPPHHFLHPSIPSSCPKDKSLNLLLIIRHKTPSLGYFIPNYALHKIILSKFSLLLNT